MKRPIRTTVLVLAMFVLAGCTPDLPEVHADPTTAGPALTVAQNDVVFASLGATLSAATASLDPADLAPRVTGPALTLRTAELKVAASVGNSEALTELPSGVQSQVIPTTQTWPRASFAVSERPQNLQTERLFVMEQGTARDQYKLWGWIRLFPGMVLPAFNSAEHGSEAVAPDDATLLLTPTDAVAHYVDVLNTGNASAYAGEFAADPFRTEMDANWTKQKAVADSLQGGYTATYAAVPDALRAIRTADGGAMVVAQIDSASTLVGIPGSIVAPTGSPKALIGDVQPTNSFSWGRTILVGIYIPPAGSDQALTVVGSESLITSASVP